MVHRKVGALRPLLRTLRWAAVVLVSLDLLLLALRLWPGLMSPEQTLAGRIFSGGVSLVLLAVVLLLARRFERQIDIAEAGARAQQEVFDALDAAIVLFDADRRIVLANRRFHQEYAAVGVAAQPGSSYEELLRAAVAAGLVADARGREDAWISQRLSQFGAASQSLLRRRPDGQWRRIVEQRLPDGRVLAHIFDVTELESQRRALEAAQRDAELARQRLSDAIGALPAGFELYDADDRLVMVNRANIELYPLIADLADRADRPPTFEEVVRTNAERGGLPELAAAGELDAWLAMRRQQRLAPGESQLQPLAGGRWVRVYERRTREGGVVAIRLDVTELEQQRVALEATRREAELAHQRLEDAIEVLPAAFELFDKEDRLLIVNRQAGELYPRVVDLLESGRRPTFEQLVRANFERGGQPHLNAEEFEAWLAERLESRRTPGGPRVHQLADRRWVRSYERRTRDGGLVGVRIDVSEIMNRDAELEALNLRLEQLNAELETLSLTDALTGIANRRHFDRRLADEVSRAARHGVPLAMAMIDLDHFKAYNDLYGHPAGDACLRRVAALLQESAGRPTDLVCRLGGEEFALLLPHQKADEALAVAARFLRALDAAAIAHAGSPAAPHVTASIGVADLAGCGGSDAAALLRAADRALYAAKQQGRHRAVAYRPA